MEKLMPLIKRHSDSLSRFIAVLVLFIALLSISPTFGQLNNLLNVLRVASLNLIIATGIAMCMMVGGIDLSVGASIALTTVLFGPMFQTGRTPGEMALGIIGILVCSGVIGLMNGFCVAYLGLVPFLATYGVQQITRGLAYLITNGAVFSNFTPEFQFIGGGYVFFGNVPVPVLIATVLLIIIGFLLSKTTMGRKIMAVGSNRETANYSGIDVKLTLMMTYMLAGLITGLAGITYISRLNAAEPTIGADFAQNAIAAAAIGGISFKGGRGNVFGIIIGALILTFVTNGMTMLGIDSNWQMGATGAIIILAVLIDRNTARKKL